jgi:hypothetical protein
MQSINKLGKSTVILLNPIESSTTGKIDERFGALRKFQQFII